VSGPTIWVAIPTFRRPAPLLHLLTTLPAVVHHRDVIVLVADNDPRDRSGEAVVGELIRMRYPLPLHLLAVGQPGLCAVRNAIVAAATADPRMTLLAMIDDDEWPQSGWLDALVACQARTGAHVVGGPVDAHFIMPPPGWVRQTLVFRPEVRPAGETGMLWASNNLLLTRDALETLAPPWFDPRFNRSGGEDLDFLARLREQGARFAWAPDARVSEWVPPDRARLSWVLARMWRIGFTETLARRKRAQGMAGGFALFGRTLAVLALRTAGLAGLLLPGARRVDIVGQWVKCWGRLYALAGGAHAHYGDS
jgi:glycosyltransferase involved in cell wall biosynthesis